MKFRISKKQPVPVADIAEGADITDLDGAEAATGWSRNGLVALYEAVYPSDVDETMAASVQSILGNWRSDAEKILLRHNNWPEIKDPEFAIFLVLCVRHRLDPWRSQAFPLMKFDAKGGNRVVLGVPIETQRAIAHETGLYAGMDAPQHEYADSRRPHRTIQTIYKLVGGQRVPFTAEANFDDYFPDDGKGTLAEIHPHVCAATVAEAGALRRAFPRELSDIYSPLEFRRPSPHGGGTDVSAASPDASVSDEETPHTYMGLHMALMDMGLDKPAEREAAIEAMRAKHPGMLERDDRGFYALVVGAVRREPTRWRAAVG